MRSVKNARKARGSARGKASRTSPRIARLKHGERPSRSRNRSAQPAIIADSLARLRGWFRGPMVLLCGGLVLLVLLIGLFVGGYVGRSIRAAERTVDAISDLAGFGIAEVHISGNTRTPPETLAAALGLEPGQSIFDADLVAARRRLMALDWVADADVRRRYPDAIYVSIVEKLPFALWQSPDGLFLIDRSGGVITAKGLQAFAGLPKLIGAGANRGAEIVDVIAVHRAVSARTKAIARISERRWNLILDQGVVVELPEAGWQKQIDTLEHLIVDKGILERDIAEIDLRHANNYFFVLKNGQKKDADGGKPI